MRNVVFGIIAGGIAFTVIADNETPFKGQETREIKALSPQEIDGYLNGRGMGHAKAAELNDYPGPKHVLDLAEELELGQEQKQQTQAIYDAMKRRAIELGEQLVEKERALDQKFANGIMDRELLGSLVSEIGSLRARIRHVHLAAHLDQKALLTKRQIHMYSKLRGYGESNGDQHTHSH